MAAEITEREMSLIDASGAGDLVKVQQLLQQGVSVNTSDAYGDSALFWSSRQGRPAVVSLLLAKGAHVDISNIEGWTPLHISSYRGQLGVVRILLDNGADTQAKSKDGWSALHFASARGHPDVVECLLTRGAELEARQNTGLRPLHYASQGGHLTTAELLLGKGADIEAETDRGFTPVVCASYRGRDDMVDFLVRQGARLDVGDNLVLKRAAADDDADKTKKKAIQSLVTKPELHFKGDNTSMSWSAQEKMSLVRTSNTRLITAGEHMCGKTSLARSIISKTQYRAYTVDRTVVVEQRQWQVGHQTIPIVDLGGHNSYRVTGMFFLANAPNNVVLLCHDVLSDRYILTYHWIKDIICHAPESHIVPVLTRTDKLPAQENLQKFKERFIEEITKFLSRDIKSLESKLEQATRKGAEHQIKKIKHVKDCYSKLVTRLPSSLLTVSTAPLQGDTIEYLKKQVLLLSSQPENQLEIPEVYQAFFGKIGCMGTKVTSNVEGSLSSSNLKETASGGATYVEKDDNQPNTPDVNQPNTPDDNQPDTSDVNQPITPDDNQSDTPDVNQPDTPDVNQPITPDDNQPDTPDDTQSDTPDKFIKDSTRLSKPVHPLKPTEAIGAYKPSPETTTEYSGSYDGPRSDVRDSDVKLNPDIQNPTALQDVRPKDKKKGKTVPTIANLGRTLVKFLTPKKKLSAKPYLLFDEAKLIFEETEREMMKEPGPLQHDVRKCLSILHDLGMLMWFKGTASLENHIFHNLQTVTRILKSVFHHGTDDILDYNKLSKKDRKRFSNKRSNFAHDVTRLQRQGIMTREILQTLLQHNQCQIEEEFVQDLLQKLNVAYKIVPAKRHESTYGIFIPYYLQDKIIPSEVIAKIEDAKLSSNGTVVLKFCFSGNITQTYFNKVLVQIYKDERLFNSLNDVWGQGVFMTLESVIFVITYDGKEEVEFIVNGLPEFLTTMWEVIGKIVGDTRQLQEEWYPGLIEAFYVLCPCQHQYAILKTASASTKLETCRRDLEQVLESQAAPSPWMCRNTQQQIPAAFHTVVKEGASNCKEMVQEVEAFVEKLQQGKVQIIEEWRILAKKTMHPDPVIGELFANLVLSPEDKDELEGLTVYAKVNLLLDKLKADRKQELVTALKATRYHSNVSLAQFITGDCKKKDTFLSDEDHESIRKNFWKVFVENFQSLDGVYDELRSDLDTYHDEAYGIRQTTSKRAEYLLDYILLRGTIQTVRLFHQALVRRRPELARYLSKAVPKLVP